MNGSVEHVYNPETRSCSCGGWKWKPTTRRGHWTPGACWRAHVRACS